MPLPRMTIGRMMLLVALMAVCTPFYLAIMSRMAPKDPFTTYARGYSEARFNTLTLGMSPDAVEAVMGKPLERGPWTKDPSGNTIAEMWYYSNFQGSEISPFCRRWVEFADGKVIADLKSPSN